MKSQSDTKTPDMFGFEAFEPAELTILTAPRGGYRVVVDGCFVQRFDTFAQAQIFCRKHTKVAAQCL